MEVRALRRLAPHPNIIRLEEVLFDHLSGRLGMVFELMDKNLYDLICGMWLIHFFSFLSGWLKVQIYLPIFA